MKMTLQNYTNLHLLLLFLPYNQFHQGILSVPGIADYKWVPARIGHFGNKKYLF